VRAPDVRPAPPWILEMLGVRGIGSFLLEGGPHINAAFLAAALIDELYWTVGAHLLGTEALPMIAAISGGSPYETHPYRGRLVSVLRHEDELFLRYRFGTAASG
jgi:riboflavin biosynthesis pyrimidine reductase